MQLQPNWSGVFITCVRKHEKKAEREMLQLFSEYVEQLVPQAPVMPVASPAINNCFAANKSISIEDQISQELAELQKNQNRLLQPIDTKTACLVFIRTKWPIDPVEMVRDICEKILLNEIKRIRWSQRLTPVVLTACATISDLENLARKVLRPYFHENSLETYKFAIRPTIRNHTKLTREHVIRTVIPLVGAQHKVDLKNYDLLIMVEIFKGICGMSVIRDFEKLKKLNITSIMESVVKKI